MKYTKPHWNHFIAIPDSVADFLDSLPAEFEIVEPGSVQVRWPEGLTRTNLRLDAIAAGNHGLQYTEASLNALAAIAPVEKKRKMKVLVTLDFGTHKVGPIESECEVDE